VENGEIERLSFCSFWIPRFSASQKDQDAEGIREMIFLLVYDPAPFFTFYKRQDQTNRQRWSLCSFSIPHLSASLRDKATQADSWERQRYERERWRVLVARKVRKKTSVVPKRFCGVFPKRCREHEKPQRVLKCLLRWCLAGRKISGCAFVTVLW
jgi:hypothetical protein